MFTKVGLTSQIQIPGLCPCGTVDLLQPLTTIQTSTHTPRSHPRRRPMPSSRPPLSVDEVGLSTQNNIPWLCPCGTVVLLRPQTTIQTSIHISRSHLQATTDASAIAQTTISNRHWIPPATGLCIRRHSPRRWPSQCHHMVTTPTKMGHSYNLCWAATAPTEAAPCTFPTCDHSSATA